MRTPGTFRASSNCGPPFLRDDGTDTTSYSYDNLYPLTSATFPGSRTVSHAFDDAGRRTSLTYPGGTNQVTYGYDNANRLSSVTDLNSNAVAYAYAGNLTDRGSIMPYRRRVIYTL